MVRGAWLTVPILLFTGTLPMPAQTATSISAPALTWIDSQVQADRNSFYVYKDADSGLNHGFPSGWIPQNDADRSKLHVDTACVYDPTSANRCATGVTKFDATSRGTVLRVTFDPLAPGQFVGLNFEEPQGYIANTDPTTGVFSCSAAGNTPNCPPRGYNLQGSTQVCFDALSPAPAPGVLFGVDGKPYLQAGASKFLSFPDQWTHQCLNLSDFGLSQSDLQSVHLLFLIESNDVNAPNGGTILLDNIQFLPLPGSQTAAVSFPLANQAIGVVHASDALAERVPIPIDQVVANVTTIYESSLATLTLLAGGYSNDAQLVANALLAALTNDNRGDSLPVAPDGSTGLHSAMSAGDLLLYNDQAPGEGLQGQVRLAGFSLAPKPDGTYSTLCGPSYFCLVEDGATGGNNAFAILALAEAYRQFKDPKYLNAARTIGNWIYRVLLDQSGAGYNGYYAGYDGFADVQAGSQRQLQTGKSIENNADIFKAFSTLANLVEEQGLIQEAAQWNKWAKIAGDFVIEMYDPLSGHFYAGTVPYGVTGSGMEPLDNTQKPETKNVYPFADAQTFVTLAMAESPMYRNAIDWRAPMQWMLDNFSVSVSTSPAAGSRPFDGINLVTAPTAGPNGVAFEFTGQAVVALRLVDQLYGETRFEAQAQHFLQEIQLAQQTAPFANGQGIVAAVMDQGDALAPYEQCVSTPFQCIAERIGLAATAWGILAEKNVNPFDSLTPANGPVLRSIVDGAAFEAGLSPGSLFSILGSNLASAPQQSGPAPLPASLGGVTVTIDGTPAPLLYVGPAQINGQIPYETATGTSAAPVTTATAQVTANGVSSAPLAFAVSPVAPRLFVGQSNICIAQNEDGTLNSPGNPAQPGHYVVPYLTGMGNLNPSVATGAAAPVSPLSRPPGPVSVTVGTQSVQPAYLGATPDSVGVGQANVQLPVGLASGLQGLSVTVGGIAGNTCLVAVGGQSTIPKPVIGGVSPQSGPPAGGTQVTISGAGFLAGLTVYFGATKVNAGNLIAVSGSSISLYTPFGTGAVAVTVTNPDGQSATLQNAFTYGNPPPAITGVTPVTGPAKGGTLVTIVGSGFQAGAVVLFGGQAASNVQVNTTGTSVQATAPPGSGLVSITVQNPDGQSNTLAAAFTYRPPPSIASIAPNPVNAAGGTNVTISGTGFVNGLTVMFGSNTVAASNVQFLNSTNVQAVAPAAPAGTVSVTVTNPDGQSAVFSGFVFAVPNARGASIGAQLQACSVAGSVSQAVLPDAFKIVVYALTNQYYVQPCTTQVLNSINPDGSFGPIPSHSGAIYVMLTGAGYNAPATLSALPFADGVNVFAITGPVGTLVGCDVAACPAQ
jgi:uncharacterized protein (TIGR03437 family)